MKLWVIWASKPRITFQVSSVALNQIDLNSLKLCLSSADFDFSQNVEGHKVEREVSSLALDIPTSTPARAAVLGFSRLQWATLSL